MYRRTMADFDIGAVMENQESHHNHKNHDKDSPQADNLVAK